MRRAYKRTALLPLFCFLIVFSSAAYAFGASTWDGLRGKLIVGYQGWFGCPGDYEGNGNWPHWFFKNIPTAENLSVDLLPSLREFKQQDLCETKMRRPDGTPVYLYSAQNEHVVATHFQWMARHGIDGAALQRFVGSIEQPVMAKRNDHMIMNAKAGAEASGRVFYITYDISGAANDKLFNRIREDWKHLTKDLKITSSPAYLRSGGKPVLEIWGFGIGDRPGTPGDVQSLIRDLKTGKGGLEAVILIGGVPTHWRTLTGDSKPDKEWASVFRSYDVISPWSVGRFTDEKGAENFVRENVLPDMQETNRLKIGYMPVVFPGFSWFNLQTGRGHPERAVLNQTPRRCGKFLWRQVYCLLNANVEMLYAAMFDEADEGTALFPVETTKDRLPDGARMVYLNQDGCVLPDDWYLQVIGRAGKFLSSRMVPPSELEHAMKMFK